MTFNIFSILL